jgi:hypothetical protein
MDFNSTIDLIIRELEEAREIIDDLKKYPGAPVLQIELARSKCKNAGEVISLLKEIHKREGFREDIEKKPEQVELKPEQGEKKSGQGELKPEHTGHETPKREHVIDLPYDIQPSEPIHIADSEEKPGHDKHNQNEENHDAEKPAKPYVAPIIADTFSHLANRFNEQVGSEKGDDYSYMQAKHISILSESIGINDRFYFIRELFGGDGNAYSKAISKIEEAGSYEDAKSIVMSSISNKKENQALKQLLDLVKRKFRPNE